MSTRLEQYRLLQDETQVGSKESFDDIDGSKSDQEPGISNGSFSRTPAQKPQCFTLFFILSTATNIILAALLAISLFYATSRSRAVLSTPPTALSPYARLPRDPSAPFPYSTGYGPSVTNHTLLDLRWEAIDINPGVVAIPSAWATQHNLSPTQPFPWDPSKGVYLITAFHTLHCLKNIHRILYDAHHGRPLSRNITHALHCVDHLRQDAMCEADDFLLPSPNTRYGDPGPRGPARVCRSWDALVAWAEERSACYRHVDDDEAAFAAGHREIERYGGCKEGSPYVERMREVLGEM
ncbi:hypothetical protein MMC17_003192 [Xylographa soralifera]|nr:hypothetical protein [Xylographa soralifera]